MSNQPQASVRKSTTWTLPAVSLRGGAPATTHREHAAAGGTPGTAVFVRANDPGVISARQPALQPREGAPTRAAGARPPARPSP